MLMPGARRSSGGPEFDELQIASELSKVAPTPTTPERQAGEAMPVVTEPLPDAATGAMPRARTASVATAKAPCAASQADSLLHVSTEPKLMLTEAMLQTSESVSAT
jgi:hypothetical protein